MINKGIGVGAEFEDVNPFAPKPFVPDWRITPATLAFHLSEGAWQPARHLLNISSKVAHAIHTSLTTGVGSYLIISMAPRHGKSELISTWTPIWILEHFPWAQVMLTTYGGELSADFSRKVRDRSQDFKDQLSYGLNPSSLNVARWHTTAGGGMYAVGINGAVTGRGAHVILVDDFIKNAEEAQPASLEKIYQNFKSTILTRRQKGCVVIIIATRWDIDDLIGRLLTEMTLPWDLIHYPATVETPEQKEKDPLGREIGEALWPEMYDEAFLKQTKDSLGSYWWQSLYQQDPYRASSGTCSGSWFRIIDIVPIGKRWVYKRAWDLSAGSGDYASGTLIGLDLESGLYYILDILRVKMDPAELEATVKATAVLDTPGIPIVIEQEPGSAGKAIISHYARNVLKGFVVTGRPSTGSKFTRATPIMAAAEAGIIRMVRAPWNKPFTDEVDAFPDGPFDDQVDSTALAYNELAIHARRASPTWGRRSGTKSIVSRQPDKGCVITGVTFGRPRNE